MDEVDALGETEKEQARRQQRPRQTADEEVEPEEERASGGDELPVVEQNEGVHGVGERCAQPADAALHDDVAFTSQRGSTSRHSHRPAVKCRIQENPD